MYNVVFKPLCYAIAIFGLVGLTTCNEKNKTSDAATNLITEAQTELNNGNVDKASILLDSLTKNYSSEIEQVKQAIHLRTLVNERITMSEIISNDSLLSICEEQVNRLKGNFKYIKTKDLVEGYTAHRLAVSTPLFNRTGIEFRIDESGKLYILSQVCGSGINLNQISISSNNGEYFTEKVPYDGTTNYKFKDGSKTNEMVTFRGNRADSLGLFVLNNINSKLVLNFIGNKHLSQPLTDKDKEAISQTYQYAFAMMEGKAAEMKKSFLDNKLQIVKKQVDRTKAEVPNNK